MSTAKSRDGPNWLQDIRPGELISQVVFREDIPKLSIQAGDVGVVIHGAPVADSLGLVRWPDGVVRLVMLHDHQGLILLRRLDTGAREVMEEGHENVGVLAEIRRPLAG